VAQITKLQVWEGKLVVWEEGDELRDYPEEELLCRQPPCAGCHAAGSSGTFRLPGATSTSAERGLLWKTAPEDDKRASPELLDGVKNCRAKG